MSEAAYDEHVAPLLLQAAQKCQELDLAMVAAVEYAPGQRAETRVLDDKSSLAMRMLSHWAKVAPNIDGFVIGLIRHCHEHGIDTSESMVVRQLTSKAAAWPTDPSPSITWPKSRDVGRYGDMAPAGQSVLRLVLDSDNDVGIEMWDNGSGVPEDFQRVSMEFCNGGGGGGQSPRTRAALINLMTAIEADNAAAPHKAFRRTAIAEGTPK